MEIPTNEDIFDTKIRELLFDVQEEILKGNKEIFLDVVKDIPGHMKNDVLATLLSMCYQQRVGYDYQDMPTQNDTDRIFMTCGTMDKVRVGDIVDFLVNVGKVKKSDIGDVTIKRKFTFVNIKSKASQKVVDRCYNQKLKGRRVRLEYAEEK